jgi:hypothetical protein
MIGETNRNALLLLYRLFYCQHTFLSKLTIRKNIKGIERLSLHLKLEYNFINFPLEVGLGFSYLVVVACPRNPSTALKITNAKCELR